jgi:hypothetical protein
MGRSSHPERSHAATICQRSTGRSSPTEVCTKEVQLPMLPACLFRGRPVHFNSIFVDGFKLFPQMDVWSR